MILFILLLQVVTAGPVVYSIILNGASQPGGQTGTALLPLFDLLNHNIEQEVSQIVVCLMNLGLFIEPCTLCEILIQSPSSVMQLYSPPYICIS